MRQFITAAPPTTKIRAPPTCRATAPEQYTRAKKLISGPAPHCRRRTAKAPFGASPAKVTILPGRTRNFPLSRRALRQHNARETSRQLQQGKPRQPGGAQVIYADNYFWRSPSKENREWLVIRERPCVELNAGNECSAGDPVRRRAAPRSQGPRR
jgi:hypothetical protein